jgi:hypothetical protein
MVIKKLNLIFLLFLILFVIKTNAQNCGGPSTTWSKQLTNNTTYTWAIATLGLPTSIVNQDNYITDPSEISAIFHSAAVSAASFWSNKFGTNIVLVETTYGNADIKISFQDLGTKNNGSAGSYGGGVPASFSLNNNNGWGWTNNLQFSIDSYGAYTDIEAVMKHEWGHTFLGIGHTEQEWNSLMHGDTYTRGFNECDVIRIGSILDPIVDITVKNSFGAGLMIIDDEPAIAIASSGKVYPWRESTFPHSVTAVNNQEPIGNPYVKKFQNWSGPSVNEPAHELDVPVVTGTYTANFLNEYNLTFKNSFVGGGNGGVIRVNNSTTGSPTSTEHVIEPNDISFTALNQTLNGIAYTFSYWDDGITSISRTEIPTDHHNFIASFVGKPVSVGNSVTFNYGAPNGTPIKLYWNDNVNSTVKYKIYRKHGKFGSTNLIATVNSGVETYTDYGLSHTNNTSSSNLTWYDVRAYYPTEDSYADTYLKPIYAELLPKESAGSVDSMRAITEISENSITNFPNPFNPTTIVYYKLKERGNVVIKVYDMLGKEVAVLVNETKSMGEYVTKFNGSNLSSGIYIMTMQINSFSISKKILLTK